MYCESERNIFENWTKSMGKQATIPPPAPPPKPGEVWISSEVVAAILRVPRPVLSGWHLTNDQIPHRKIGERTFLYKRAEVLEWQRSQERKFPIDWAPVAASPGKSESHESEAIEWMFPVQAAEAIGISRTTLGMWMRRRLGLPFTLIEGGGSHEVMFERRDVEEFIRRRDADPSVVPVISKGPIVPKVPDTRTREQRRAARARTFAANKLVAEQVWREIEHSEDEIA